MNVNVKCKSFYQHHFRILRDYSDYKTEVEHYRVICDTCKKTGVLRISPYNEKSKVTLENPVLGEIREVFINE